MTALPERLYNILWRIGRSWKTTRRPILRKPMEKESLIGMKWQKGFKRLIKRVVGLGAALTTDIHFYVSVTCEDTKT
jgi:hypothetical protein